MSDKFLVGTLAQMHEVRAAIAKAEGLPRRAIVVGGPDLLPTTYSPGAAGWTDNVCPEPVDGEDGTAALEVPEEAEKHLGKRVRVNGKDVDIPTKAQLVLRALAAKFEAKLPPRGNP